MTDSPLSRGRAAIVNDLADAISMIADLEEARAFLSDLCTPAELHTLAERWHVARLLAAGDKTYRQIHEETGVSTTTITRVARFLNQEGDGGYRTVLNQMEKAR